MIIEYKKLLKLLWKAPPALSSQVDNPKFTFDSFNWFTLA